MDRVNGWQNNLIAWLATCSRTPFEPGNHDCAMFAAGAIFAMTGVDYAESWRGRYKTLRGGVRVLRRDGYNDHIDFVRKNFIRTENPDIGDLAIVQTGEGLALGIVQGSFIYATAAVGWAMVPIEKADEFLKV